MSQIIQKLDQQQLKSLCGIVAHTSEGLTKSELTTLLGQCGICAVDDGSSRNQLGYTIGLNKRDCKDHIETRGFKSYIHSTGTSKQ